MASDRNAASPPRPRIGLRKPALIVALLALLLVAAILWLGGTASGARAAFALAQGISGGALHADGIEGRLAGPLRIAQFSFATADSTLRLDDLQIDWLPSALMNNTVHVTSLRARHLVLDSVQKKKDEPSALPKKIALPFRLLLDNAQIDSGDIRRDGVRTAALGAARLGAAFDGERYRLDLREFNAGTASEQNKSSVRIEGAASLSATSPYALDGRFSVNGNTRSGDGSMDARGAVEVGGSLAELQAKLGIEANQAVLEGTTTLRPFTDRPLGKADFSLRALDLSRFDAALPTSSLEADLQMTEDCAGILRMRNKDPGTYDRRMLPLSSFDLAFHEQPGAWYFDRINLYLGTGKQPAGTMQGSGKLIDGALTLSLLADALDLKRLDLRARTTRLKGGIDLTHAQGRQSFSLSFTEPLQTERLAAELRGTLADRQLNIERLSLQAGSGRIEASGHAALAGTQRFDAKASVTRFRLQELGSFPQLPALELNGSMSLSGVRQPGLEADLSFNIVDSTLAGQALVGEGEARLRGERLHVPRFFLSSGANRVEIAGQLTDDDAQLSFTLEAPQLRQLGSAFGGAMQAKGTIRGNLARPHLNAQWSASQARLPGMLHIDAMRGKADVLLNRGRDFILDTVDAELNANGLRHGDDRVTSLAARLRFAPQPDAPLSLMLRAEGIHTGQLLAERMTAMASGTTARHTVDAALTEAGQDWTARANGGLHTIETDPQWKGNIDAFKATGRFTARLAAASPLFVSAQRIQLDRFHVDADVGHIAVDQFMRDETGMATRGRIDNLEAARLLQHAAPSAQIRTNLLLGGEWDVRLGDVLAGTIAMRREAGDVTVLGATPLTLGLSALTASANITGGRLAAQLHADGKRLGSIDVNAGTTIGDGDRKMAIADNAPLTGSARIDIPSLAWVGPMLAPTISLDGALQTDVSVGGTFSQPRLGGSIAGQALRLVMSGSGLDLRQGILASTFEGDQLQLHRLSFQGAEGLVSLSGPIDFGGGKVAASLALRADRFAVLNRADRRIVISGDSRLDWQDRGGKLSGQLKVDSGFIDLGRADKPQLSDDVVIVGRDRKQSAKTALALDLMLSLGEGVKIVGRGLDAILGGEIRILNAAGETMQAQGTFHVIKGTYSAYGRELDIEQGGLRFRGAINNPSLDILAMRRGQEVEAGVSVRGNVLSPRVTLVSEPTVPDAEKLSWLVLGRGVSTASGDSDAGALQAAAAALLSEGAKAGVQSRIASAFGLDTFNVGTSQDSLQQRIVTLGKQISSKLYVSYQQGLETAGSVIQLRYALSPKLSVEAEAGSRSAISLFYNIAFD